MTPAEPSSWLQAFRIYTHPRVLGMLSLGFSAGLPLLLILGTLSFWLREAGIDRSTIGHLSWIGLAYGFKWLWAPLVDRLGGALVIEENKNILNRFIRATYTEILRLKKARGVGGVFVAAKNS